MSKGEPPSLNGSKSSPFFVGKNSSGNWVVQDQRGLRGGLFIDRAEALKFARSENDGSHRAVIVVKGLLELDMSPVRRSVQLSSFSAVPTELPRVA